MTTKNKPAQSVNLCDDVYKSLDDLKIQMKNSRILLKEEMGIFTILGLQEYFEKQLEFIIDNKGDECRDCSSKNVVDNGTTHKKVNKDDNINIYGQKYHCKNCGKYYQTESEFLLPKYSNYINEIREFPGFTSSLALISRENLSKIIHKFTNAKPVYNTIKNYISNCADKIRNIPKKETILSGYYQYDEEYVGNCHGWDYRLTLIDDKNKIIAADEIYEDCKKETVRKFIETHTFNQPLIAITTDGKKSYRSIMDQLDVEHQLCHAHYKRNINKLISPILKSEKYTEKEKENYRHYKKQIFKILDSTTYEEAKLRLEILKKQKENIPKKLQKTGLCQKVAS
ncbi:hypothetical protein [Methanobrevibacter filiformis]|uniref:Transposase IS66 central domain-containing protein n=1 Tax=Methanobrevibacter filiformis TaxID=55758 RepID=A0A165ZRI5_9EURY|nr:hypothetical protein [Methanobrevibacter filiformis]KZX11069.1 hypothetical protein MBFIL_15400 [Methanobrevibacter filiformis]